MNIVLTFDDSYVQHASVLIASVCSNNDGLINFFIISDYISDQNVKHINELVYAYKNSVTFIMLDKHSLEKFPIGEGTANTYVSLATYYRLLIPDLIPLEINKVIYLDCDIVVNGDLSDLWNYDVSKVCLAALEEQPSLCFSGCKRLKYDQQYSYFNAGVLLLNLENIRKICTFNDFTTYIREHHKDILFHDQDVLNKFFHASKKFIPLKYNVMDACLLKKPNVSKLYIHNMEDIFRPIVIHYSGPIKPWHKECKNPYKSLYYHYLSNTFWKNYKSQNKYTTLKDVFVFRSKSFMKFVLELLHVHYYSYIKI